ncbi:MAG: hypothetical protein H6707_09485 [Deltaproteobacteria bacterium]|nr:hypothetical protein [Deltaproteobacteria bacterium]
MASERLTVAREMADAMAPLVSPTNTRRPKPTTSLRPDEVRKLLAMGRCAPSGGNVQPWRAEYDSHGIELYLDPARSDNLLDVGRLAAVMAVGSFLENVLIGAASLGVATDVRLTGTANAKDLRVHVDFTGREHRPTKHPLHAAVWSRCTNRLAHRGPPLEDQQIDALKHSVAELGTNYKMFATPDRKQKKQIAKILAAADRIRFFHRELHSLLFAELRFTPEASEQTADGIDVRTLEMPRLAVLFLKLLRSYRFTKFCVPNFLATRISKSALVKSSHLATLAIPDSPDVEAFLTLGRSLQRMWLTADTHNLAIQPWAVLPFFYLRARYWDGAGFSGKERDEILSLQRQFADVLGVPAGYCPIFNFRISRAERPQLRALRLPIETFAHPRNVGR